MTGVCHLDLVPCGCQDNDSMADTPHRSHPLCPLDKDKMVATPFGWFSLFLSQRQWETSGQTPESQIVCVMPRCHFRSWTWFRMAASGTGAAPRWLCWGFGSTIRRSHFCQHHGLETQWLYISKPRPRETGQGWAAPSAKNDPDRADPNNLPNGQAELGAFGGALNLFWPPKPPHH